MFQFSLFIIFKTSDPYFFLDPWFISPHIIWTLLPEDIKDIYGYFERISVVEKKDISAKGQTSSYGVQLFPEFEEAVSYDEFSEEDSEDERDDDDTDSECSIQEKAHRLKHVL